MAVFFKKINPAAARLHTLFSMHVRGLSFTAGGGTWTADAACPPAEHGATVYGKLGETEFTVWLNDPDWRIAAATTLASDPAGLDRFPEPLIRAALECFAGDVLGTVERATGLPLSVANIEISPSTPVASACRFSLKRADGLTLGGAWLVRDPDAGWLGVIEKAFAGNPAPRMNVPDDVPLTASVGIGTWTVPASILDGLEAGDVVLSPAGPERFVVVGGVLRFAARMENGILAVEGKTMTQAEPAPGSDAGELAALDAVEVELQARVGTLAMTMAQFRRLGEGQVVEFSTPVESPVVLAVNGKPFCVGELLDVGGRVGVRILKMKE